jgi:MOSC domain-containing protein YiiM
MEIAHIHLTALELEQGLADVLASPRDKGLVRAIFVRPRENERQSLAAAMLSPEGGVEGDRWPTDHWQKLPDGRSDPKSQVSLMNSRVLELMAGEEAAMGLSGDNFIVDLNLSDQNLPAGSHLHIGENVVLEITEQAHSGCGKFSRRFGQQALEFINGPQGRHLNQRGRFGRIITGGTINVGDAVVKA